MFLSYYGLREQPFGVTPDPRFLYLGEVHREALASLIYGVESGLGFASLIAEPGTGKTTLLYYLLQYYRETARTAFLFDSQCDSRELLRNLLLEFELDPSGGDAVVLSGRLRDFLLAQARARRRVIVVLDEAQNFDDSVLESVRLLSNFETPGAKLLHIILSGQPQLAEKLLQPHLLNVRQRISMATRLRPFAPVDVAKYVAHRLKTAGLDRNELFTSEALATLARLSGGVPREINRLCFNAMSIGCALDRHLIDEATVQDAAKDFDFSQLLAASTGSEDTTADCELAEVFAAAMRANAQSAPQSASGVVQSIPPQCAQPPAVYLQTAIAQTEAHSAAAACAVREKEPPAVHIAELRGGRRATRALQALAAIVFVAIAGFAITRPAGRHALPETQPVAENTVVTQQTPSPTTAQTSEVQPVALHAPSVAANVPAESPRPMRQAVPQVRHQAVDVIHLQDRSVRFPLAANSYDGRPVTILKRVYPPPASSEAAARLSGEVAMNADVGTDGRVESVSPLAGPSALQEVAADTVRQWIFEPRLVNGEPQPMRVRVRLWVTR